MPQRRPATIVIRGSAGGRTLLTRGPVLCDRPVFGDPAILRSRPPLRRSLRRRPHCRRMVPRRGAVPTRAALGLANDLARGVEIALQRPPHFLGAGVVPQLTG